MLPDDTCLPSLKSLSLSYVRFSNLGVFERLTSACPSLEELNIRVRKAREFWRLFHILSCPTLKRLSIKSLSYELGSISFDFPNLVYLYYFDFVQREYPVVKFDSLVEAKLDLRLIYGDSEDPSNLFKGLRNVEKLGLTFPETFEVFDYYDEVVPVFENVTQLSILTDEGFCSSLSTLPALPSVLKKFPNVHTLVIEGDLIGHDFSEGPCGCFSEDYCTLSSPAKVLEITKYEGSIDEMEQIKRFLEELSCLELVKVRAFAKGYKAKSRLTTDLLMLPRASSKCKIQVEFC